MTYTELSRDVIREQFPEIYNTLESLMSEKGAKVRYQNFWIPYSGRYTWKNGKPRYVTMGQIFEFLHGHGYRISLTVEKM